MASIKEATVFIVDLGRSMGKTRHGREQSDLDWSLQYVWDRITEIVALGRKTLFVGVIGLGTDATKNGMSSDEAYAHISVLQELSPTTMAELRHLSTVLKHSQVDQRDAISAIILGVDMINKHCRNLQYKKKLVLITNATAGMDPDDIPDIAKQIQQSNIELVVLGVDFDDPEYGVKEEDKSVRKRENEEILKNLTDLCGGMIGTMQEAIDDLEKPTVKQVRPTPTYKGQLRLGDPENYDTALTIDVERYAKVMVARPPTASSFAVRTGASQVEDPENLTGVRTTFAYSYKNSDNSDVALERDELAKGYEYGRTVVPISETDENITKLDTSQSYDILGFIPAENVERYMILENTNMIVAQKGNTKAALALSSFIHGLFELGSVAIARLVKRDMSEPILTLLSPSVETDFECLIEATLPFAEDLRIYRFPPVDKIVTVSGNHLTLHRNLPSSDLLSAMSDFVDSMSLVPNTNDDDDELMPIDDTYSPVLHTIKSAIKSRAVHPNTPLPAKPALFQSYAHPPPTLLESASPQITRLISTASVKKVPPKARGRRRYRETEKPLSGLDVESLFHSTETTKRGQISADNAIPEFRQLLDNAETPEAIQSAVDQFKNIILGHIRESFGDSKYALAVEELGVLREEMVALEEVGIWNAVVREVKAKVLGGELGGERREFWWGVRKAKLGLVEDGETGREEVEEFLRGG